MPTVARKDVLAASYKATLEAVTEGGVPTTALISGHTLFRAVPAKYIPKPAAGGSVSKRVAASAMQPRDGAPGSEKSDKNRFTGLSYHAGIAATGGLYCVLQQQALMNEAMHYARMEADVMKAVREGAQLRDAALANRCVVKLVLMGRLLLADLSPHNPGAERFLQKLSVKSGLMQLLANTQYASKVSFWDRLVDSDDCSVARGVGLALSSLGYVDGILAQTVRRSGRSVEEKGDNVVLFGKAENSVPGIYVDQVFYFDATGKLERFGVAFP